MSMYMHMYINMPLIVYKPCSYIYIYIYTCIHLMYKHIPTYIETLFKDSLSLYTYIYISIIIYVHSIICMCIILHSTFITLYLLLVLLLYKYMHMHITPLGYNVDM